MEKFKKDRSVQDNWLGVPVKYMLRVTGSNEGSSSKYVPKSLDKQYNEYLEFHSRLLKDLDWDDEEPMTLSEYKDYLNKNPEFQETEYIPAKHDKTFCIIEISKNWATCGWRNNSTGSIGMPIKCKIVKKGKRIGIMYKDKFRPIDDSYGWVF